MKLLFADLETYSETPIKYGTHAYAEHAEVLLFGYAIDKEPARVWDATSEPMPQDLKEALDEAMQRKCMTVWHNGMMFDTVVLKYVMGIDLPVEMVLDTMVMAYECGLPGALEILTHDVFRMADDKAKDREGKALVNLFCKPRPANQKLRRATKATHPEKWAAFVNYCRLDVEAERELFYKLPRFNLTKQERVLQCLDARINRRGMLMDIELAKGAVRLDEVNKKALAGKVTELTGGEVLSATQSARLKGFFKGFYGVDIDSLTKGEIVKRLSDDTLPEPVQELLHLRLQSAKTAVKKYEVTLNSANSDGRLRGCLQFRGASRTGRWAGRLFQPQNMPRPTMKKQADIDEAIEYVKNGLAEFIYEDPSHILSNCLRGQIIVPNGKKLVVADYSNVEGRTLAWLADETWKIKAFNDFDTWQLKDGTWVTPDKRYDYPMECFKLNEKGEPVTLGHDLYKVTYGKTFAVAPEDVNKQQRQMGKVIELGLGYGGGVGAFLTFARGYGINLDDMAVLVKQTVDLRFWQQAEEYYFKAKTDGRTEGLAKDTFTACDAVKRAWRETCPRIVSLWRAAEVAVINAVENPGVEYSIGTKVKTVRRGNYLLIKLPSGRFLVYASPRLGEGDCAITYQGVDQKTRQWKRLKTYGGKLVENITQAVACDLMSNGMLLLEQRGYETVLTVHDEVLTEAPDTDAYDYRDMEKTLATLPDWATGLPLVAAGYESYRYRKD